MSLKKLIAGAAVVAALGLSVLDAPAARADAHIIGCGHALVTSSQFDTVAVGWSRWRVQQFFDNCGTRIGMYADEHHRHLAKRYPGADGQVFVIWFRGRLTQHPFGAPYHVESKEVR